MANTHHVLERSPALEHSGMGEERGLAFSVNDHMYVVMSYSVLSVVIEHEHSSDMYPYH